MCWSRSRWARCRRRRKSSSPQPRKSSSPTGCAARLDQIALANAGDPGPVVLRRLSNMEYTYTLRDLTGIESLDPAREFPIDGAAGEGFTNAGAALVMSPALLTKYLDAAKDIASHAVFTPHGMRWSASTSARDWTDETLASIRSFYAHYSAAGGSQAMNLQGVKFDTNAGGRLPLSRYLDALQGRGSADGLSAKYLQNPPRGTHGHERVHFARSTASEVPREKAHRSRHRALAAGFVAIRQRRPHRQRKRPEGLAGAGDAAHVPNHEMRVKLTSDRDVTLYLTTTDAGDGSAEDEVIWGNARLVAPGRPDLQISGLPVAREASWKPNARRSSQAPSSA
jgi:hypothetical protein